MANARRPNARFFAPVPPATTLAVKDSFSVQAIKTFKIDLVELLAAHMKSRWESTALLPQQGPSALRDFNLEKTLSLPPGEYVQSLLQGAGYEESTFLLAFIYLDQLFAKYPFYFNLSNFYYLFITSLVLAGKISDDAELNNAGMATLGLLPLEKLNRLEKIMVKSLDWKLIISPELFEEKCLHYLCEYLEFKGYVLPKLLFPALPIPQSDDSKKTPEDRCQITLLSEPSSPTRSHP